MRPARAIFLKLLQYFFVMDKNAMIAVNVMLIQHCQLPVTANSAESPAIANKHFCAAGIFFV